MRFLSDRVPDARTIWLFRERLTKAGAINALFERFDAMLRDAGYRSAANEAFMEKNGFVSRVHRKKPKGRPMPETIRRANNLKSKVRSRGEHVFGEQKSRMGLFIRTIGIARATTKIGMANMVFNMKRLIHLQRVAAVT